MKKLLLALFIAMAVLIAPALPSLADEVKFGWTQVISDDFAGWKFYIATVSGGPYEQAGDPILYSGNPSDEYTETITIEALEEPTVFYVVATAFDLTGNESVYSEEVSFTLDPPPDTTPPAEPQTLTVTVEQQ